MVAVDAVNPTRVDMAHAAVVAKAVAAPVSAFIAASVVSMAVVHAAAVADVARPMTVAPAVLALAVVPVAGRPQRAGIRCEHPRPWYPVITEIRPGPVPRRPDVVFAGSRWLIVLRQGRWRFGRNRLRGVVRAGVGRGCIPLIVVARRIAWRRGFGQAG